MAYPIVCEPCLNNDHDKCMEQDPEFLAERQERIDNEIVGGAFCICPTCKVDNAWTRSVYERDLATLRGWPPPPSE